MSLLSNKCLYALRAVFELSKQGCFVDSEYNTSAARNITISEIASRQSIPCRFLESILRDLKNAGFAASIRGKEGGYYLVKSPNNITAGQIVRLFQKNLIYKSENLKRNAEHSGNQNIESQCLLESQCLEELSQNAINAYYSVLDGTTFLNLLEEAKTKQKVLNFSI